MLLPLGCSASRGRNGVFDGGSSCSDSLRESQRRALAEDTHGIELLLKICSFAVAKRLLTAGRTWLECQPCLKLRPASWHPYCRRDPPKVAGQKVRQSVVAINLQIDSLALAAMSHRTILALAELRITQFWLVMLRRARPKLARKPVALRTSRLRQATVLRRVRPVQVAMRAALRINRLKRAIIEFALRTSRQSIVASQRGHLARLKGFTAQRQVSWWTAG